MHAVENMGKQRMLPGLAAVCLVLAASGCPSFLPIDLRAPSGSEHWLRFVQINDIHITDTESPARLVPFDIYQAGSWRPGEAYSVQVLDAVLQEVNRTHYSGLLTQNRPVDFVLFAGDLTENAQYNELRWFIDTVDGKTVTPDSGELDGPNRPGDPADNPYLPCNAAGLARDIPWYAAMGNHDYSGNGNFTIDRSSSNPEDWTAPIGPVIGRLLGLQNLTPPQSSLQPAGSQSLAIILAGVPEPIDPHTFQLRMEEMVSGSVPSDPMRHYISKQIFIQEMFNSTTQPFGHGFGLSARITGQATFSFRPKRDIPVRIIVLDSAGPDAMEGYLGANGAISRTQFDGFLKPEIQAAREAGEYVIVVSHHPSSAFIKPTVLPSVRPSEFTSYLASQPNIIAHLCGHVHYHHTLQHGGRYPYPEIITASLIDYPQEGRIFDLYYDRDKKTFHILTAFIGHASRPTHLSATAYFRATTDLFVDPESAYTVERISYLDLTQFEDFAQTIPGP